MTARPDVDVADSTFADLGGAHAAFLRALVEAARSHPGVKGLFVSGSLAKGEADEFSDLDFVAVADPIPSWPDLVKTFTELVLVRESTFGPKLTNMVTGDWMRCDILTLPPEAFGAFQAVTALKPVFDPAGLLTGAEPVTLQLKPDVHKISAAIEEFIRVLGLTPVVLGRDEHVLAVTGLTLMRANLMTILVEATAQGGRRGALHLRGVLPPEDLALLRSLDLPAAEPNAIRAATCRYAAAFFARGREIADGLGIVWPTQLEAAVRRHLSRTLQLTF